MNPWDISASDLLVWGIVLHFIADWPLQNDWMVNNKMLRRYRWHKSTNGPMDTWWDRHPSAYVHAGIHGVLLALIFGWLAVPLAIVHLIIDTRAPVMWWSKKIGQTQPSGTVVETGFDTEAWKAGTAVLYDMGTEVRFWTDQVFHIICVAVAALLVTL